MRGRRAFLAGLFAVAAVLPALASAAPKPPTVLFICEFGTAKSAIAREMFRRRAKQRGIAVTAFSRGSRVIEDHVEPPLKAALAAQGIDSRRDGFSVLSPRDLRNASIIVTFVLISESVHWRELHDWTTVPSVNTAWPVARADLDARIDALLDEIVARQVRRK